MNPMKRVKDAGLLRARFAEGGDMIARHWVRSRLIITAAVCGLAASCANGPIAPPQFPPVVQPAPPLPSKPVTYASSGHAAMDAWRDDFTARALAAGRDRAIVVSLLSNISPMTIWLGSDVQAQAAPSAQAEFSKPLWEYLRVPLGETRVRRGREKLASLSRTLDSIEAAYGVDRKVLIAIWGMETSFGGFMGRDDAANALANMATEGRRRKLAETELYALMDILASGGVRRDQLVAGWAGAMGHTQFMPSTFVAHAVDFDGDGRKDLWKSEADALASAANYLARSGYRRGEPWGIEVNLPEGFDYGLADGSERRMSDWTAAGLTPALGGSFETGGAEFAELWVPAGASGPKWLLFKNFNVFKTYNRADSYALAVGLSGDAIAGAPGLVASWPTHLPPLSVAEIRQLQAGLNARGFDAGAVDGIAGRQTRRALQAFQKTQGLVADGYPTRPLLALLTGGAAGSSN